ncbi:MAG TPA: hypothetical protein VNK43_01750 [Gemmatimonadales bacterium]|nr:hypothetical protein [Gemmatimonadales bacterium]
MHRHLAVPRSSVVLALVGWLGVASPAVRPGAAQQAAPPTPAANPADVGSVDAIITALYDVISGPAGPRDWNRFRSLFVPGARLIPVVPRKDGGFSARVLGVEDYIGQAGSYFNANGFFEREVARRTERYGQLVHAFSTYESRHARDDARPFTRGINSIQLLDDGQRWWVVTIMWDAERPGNPVPEEYLQSGR